MKILGRPEDEGESKGKGEEGYFLHYLSIRISRYQAIKAWLTKLDSGSCEPFFPNNSRSALLRNLDLVVRSVRGYEKRELYFEYKRAHKQAIAKIRLGCVTML